MKRRILKQNLLLITAVFFAVTFLSSCLKSNDDNNSNIPVAGLMAFNLSPDKSAIGIALSGNNLTNVPLGYTNFTGGYLPIYPGTRSIIAFNAGSGSSFTASDYTFNADKYYSLFVLGVEDNYRNVVVKDELDSLLPSPGKAYIRYINAIPDSGQPLVTVTDNANNVIHQNAAFASVSPFAEANIGSATIAITDNNQIQASRSITLEERKVYTILFTGVTNATDTTHSIQIKYIENGTLQTDSTSKQQSVAFRGQKASVH